MIVAVVAEKGGVGKTMVATNLAGMRASVGRRVLLIDADRQGSATFWTDFRAERELPRVEPRSMQGEAFRRFISVRRVLYDDILVDVGAGDGPNLDTALRHSDCSVVPVRPTGVDMYTMQLMDFRVAEARGVNPGLRAIALINQASANPRHQALGIAVASLRNGVENLVVAETVIRDRVVYQRSHMLGQTVLEYLPRDDRGTGEMLSFYQEVFGEEHPAVIPEQAGEMASVSGGGR